MALPSIQNLIQDIRYVIMRFPLEIAFAIIGSIAAIINIRTGYPDTDQSYWFTRVIMTANLGLLFSLSASLYLESRAVKGPRLYLFKIIVALLASGLIFLLNPALQEDDYQRFFLLSLAGHLLVSFAAYVHADSVQGFWQFNKTIFLRFLTSVLNSGVLYLGLAAAIGATKFLFNVDLGSNSYSILFVLIAGIFNTLFFLAGIPKDLDTLNEDFTYPKALKIFTQYVLIPLATIYVIILLAYEAKIIIEWNLPKGLVSNLILGYAVFGILAILMIFPIREQEENKWIKTYARSFYFLMLPLIVLLFLAVGTRVFRYGITENRYFLIMLAIWLLGVTIYSLLSRKQNIKVIPISLCIFTLLSIYGPQSAFSVSEYSQKKILTDIFKRNNAFKDHKMTRLKSISAKDGNRAARTLRYIIEHYDYQALQPYTNANLDHVSDSLEHTKEATKANKYSRKYFLREAKVSWVQSQLGLGKFSSSAYGDYESNEKRMIEDAYVVKNKQPDLTNVAGYDYVMQDHSADNSDVTVSGNLSITKTIKNKGWVSVKINNDSALFDLKALIGTLPKDPAKQDGYKFNGVAHEYNLPSGALSIVQETKNFRIVYQVNSISYSRGENKVLKDYIYSYGVFLIKVK
ncbi:protein of unknown function [Pedobacter westerhofensis]|uniref:DUF4153 domain-containing protein n=1 Tax=Pedobacter westerhofensis TaxID=425512 RepID=A0A521ECN1_9SPHI|nr:DUF4153 domain-containing protein [Pedobacter westerhofensis]SMO80940.1 protein of unknown function [Pedobacter westerhofensis]